MASSLTPPPQRSADRTALASATTRVIRRCWPSAGAVNGARFLRPRLEKHRLVLSEPCAPEEFAALAARCGRAAPAARVTRDDRGAKTSAAWLIEHAGFRRGYGRGRVGISSKLSLALVNRGGVITAELLALARELRRGVLDAFGIVLDLEPTLVGVPL